MKYITGAFKRVREMYALRHGPENVRILAHAYWRTLLIFALLSVVAICAWGIWEFSSTMSRLGGAGGANVVPSAGLDRAELRATLRVFDDRQTQFNALRSGGANIADPSR